MTIRNRAVLGLLGRDDSVLSKKSCTPLLIGSEKALIAFNGSSTIKTLPPRPVIAPPIVVLKRLPPREVRNSRSVVLLRTVSGNNLW